MVDIAKIESKLAEMENYFQSVKSNSTNSGDMESASYGLSKVELIRNALKKYQDDPQKRFLRQIDAGFTSATRGVEGFGDYKTNEKFLEVTKGIMSIWEDLDSHIRS